MRRLVSVALVVIASAIVLVAPIGSANEAAVLEDLPYPGILVDHPLYFLKETRDNAWLILTREPNLKSDLLRHIADKKMSMTFMLTDKGKWNLAVQVALEAEDDLQKAAESAQEAIEEKPSDKHYFIEKTTASIDVHNQALADLQRIVPQGERDRLDEALKVNEETRKLISN